MFLFFYEIKVFVEQGREGILTEWEEGRDGFNKYNITITIQIVNMLLYKKRAVSIKPTDLFRFYS